MVLILADEAGLGLQANAVGFGLSEALVQVGQTIELLAKPGAPFNVAQLFPKI